MRQTSEEFAKKMLEDDVKGNPVSFSEQMAQLENKMNERINELQSNILKGIAEANRPPEEVEEVHEIEEVNETTDEKIEE